MTEERRLIVNADDFGRSDGVNAGIIHAHESGIVTSASLMVRWPAARDASSYSKANDKISVGLHLDLGEWQFNNGQWVPLYLVVELDDAAAVKVEVMRQLRLFREMTGRDPTHLDSHQHVHEREPVRSVAIDLSRSLGLPLRHHASGVRYCGAFYGQTTDGEGLLESISPSALQALLSELPTSCSELACHPAREVDFETMYRQERTIEMRTLCDPQVRKCLDEEGIILSSFRDTR